jgi:hypothetical protein
LAAVTEEGKLVCKNRAYATVDIDVSGHMQTFLAAIHVDKQPMALVGTTCGSAEPPAVSQLRRYWDFATHNVTNWVGTLQQPRIHQLYRDHFNGVDLHNRYTFGPGSVALAVETKAYELRLFLRPQLRLR